MVDDELTQADGRRPRRAGAGQELQGRAIEVVEARRRRRHLGDRLRLRDPRGADGLDPGRRQATTSRARAADLKFVRSRNDKIPIFLMAERGEASSIPIDVMEMVDEYIWTLEDTAAFVGGRVVAAIRRYLEVMLPPLAAALMKFSQEYEYSWHTPGHTGGTAFLKSPVGPHLLRLLRREPAALRPVDQRRRAGLAARSHRARSASTRSTPRGSSARTAPTPSPTAPRCRTA